jgi:NAD(P)-dependent dehydrogenase (short-subunit alcohol dehydrogenase family)
VNVHAPIDLAQAVLPSMIEAGEGWIVNLSSGSTRHVVGPPFPQTAIGWTIGVYGGSKAALNRMTNALAHEVYGTGVRINTVEPRAAVMSEGASELVGKSVSADQIESMEQMVEGTLVLCDCAADFTARCCVSLDLIDEFGLVVRNLDGTPIESASEGAS